ncbi:MAG: proline dehydrogenase family protein [Propionibacteriaceae bacterium]
MSVVAKKRAALVRSMVQRTVHALPTSADVNAHFVPAQDSAEALTVAAELVGHGLWVTLDDLELREAADPEQACLRYLDHIDAITSAGLSNHAELAIRLNPLGLVGDVTPEAVLENVTIIAKSAKVCGVRVTLILDDPHTMAAGLVVAQTLRSELGEIGITAVLSFPGAQAAVSALADVPEARIALIKRSDRVGTSRLLNQHETDLAYVATFRDLLAGSAKITVATHDSRLIAITRDALERSTPPREGVEFQFLYGISLQTRRALAEAGYQVRVVVPFGIEGEDYVAARVADFPADLALHLRALARSTKARLVR